VNFDVVGELGLKGKLAEADQSCDSSRRPEPSKITRYLLLVLFTKL